MIKEQLDKENQMPSVTLDFKKKPKSKPSTDRASSSNSLFKTQQLPTNTLNTLTLLQKKKQYSQIIRQKNLHKETKKPPAEVVNEKTLTERHMNSPQTFKFSSSTMFDSTQFGSFKSQQESRDHSARIQSIYKPLQQKKDTKSKGRVIKQQNKKLQQLTLMIEGIKEHNFDQNYSISSSIKNFTDHERKLSNDFSVIEKINDISKIEGKAQICPQVVNEVIGPFFTEEMKEIDLLKKQNSTFKKELANFRKQNGCLKREMQELKKQITLFQERNDYLEEQSAEQFKLLESLQAKNSQSMEAFAIKEASQISKMEAAQCDGKLKEIISAYQNSLFQATNLNKKLQFRNYMLEKRLMDETETHKKLMAKEISMWKDRYVKARNQNLRLKDSRGQLLFEMSISQEM